MRADQHLSAHMGGDVFQIACEDTDTIIELTERLRPWLNDGQGLPGFKISVPQPGNRMWVLLGSNGNVLGRSTQQHAIIEILLRHLAALIAPQREATQRLDLGAYASSSGVVLIDPSLLRSQPPIERQLAEAGFSMVDSPFVEANTVGPPSLSAIAASEFALDDSLEGHLHSASVSGRVRGLLWPSSPDAADVTPGQIAHALAKVAKSGTREARIDFGISWADSLHVRLVDALEKHSVLLTAKALLGSPG